MEEFPTSANFEALLVQKVVEGITEVLDTHNIEPDTVTFDVSTAGLTLQVPYPMPETLWSDLEAELATHERFSSTFSTDDQYLHIDVYLLDIDGSEIVDDIEKISEPVHAVVQAFVAQLDEAGYPWVIDTATDDSVTIEIQSSEFSHATFTTLLGNTVIAGVNMTHNPDTRQVTFSPKLH